MADTLPYPYRPGIHSHNRGRSRKAGKPHHGLVTTLRVVLLLIGFACLGYYAYFWADENIYQSYQNWAFEQQKSGRLTQDAVLAPPDGSIIGRLTIDRLNISAMVRQGVDSKTLSKAVGHVPTTAFPGHAGNFAVAAHRDTLFRGLKDIQTGDLIRFETSTGKFQYKVAATRIVKPTDVSVLRPDGGGLLPPNTATAPPQLLTMITCYPFYYIGSAPERFIVQARRMDDTAAPVR